MSKEMLIIDGREGEGGGTGFAHKLEFVCIDRDGRFSYTIFVPIALAQG